MTVRLEETYHRSITLLVVTNLLWSALVIAPDYGLAVVVQEEILSLSLASRAKGARHFSCSFIALLQESSCFFTRHNNHRINHIPYEYAVLITTILLIIISLPSIVGGGCAKRYVRILIPWATTRRRAAVATALVIIRSAAAAPTATSTKVSTLELEPQLLLRLLPHLASASSGGGRGVGGGTNVHVGRRRWT